MPKKEYIEVVAYETTLYDVMIENIKGKYLQNIAAPHLIAQIPKENNLGIHYVEDGKLSVWFPLLERHGDISLDEFRQYAIISEEQFENYKNTKKDLQNIVLAHKDSKIVRENKQT